MLFAIDLGQRTSCLELWLESVIRLEFDGSTIQRPTETRRPPASAGLYRACTIATMGNEQQYPPRGSSMSAICLEDKFEVIEEIGDGSFGSVALARVRTAGAHVARRGTLVSRIGATAMC